MPPDTWNGCGAVLPASRKRSAGFWQNRRLFRSRINQCRDELDVLYEEVSDAYDREERRKEEFVIEREISPVPYRAMIMPWTKEVESERRFRRAVLVALLICFVFGSLIPLIKVPIPDRSVAVVEIPKRLVKLVKKELPSRADAEAGAETGPGGTETGKKRAQT